MSLKRMAAVPWRARKGAAGLSGHNDYIDGARHVRAPTSRHGDKLYDYYGLTPLPLYYSKIYQGLPSEWKDAVRAANRTEDPLESLDVYRVWLDMKSYEEDIVLLRELMPTIYLYWNESRQIPLSQELTDGIKVSTLIVDTLLKGSHWTRDVGSNVFIDILTKQNQYERAIENYYHHLEISYLDPNSISCLVHCFTTLKRYDELYAMYKRYYFNYIEPISPETLGDLVNGAVEVQARELLTKMVNELPSQWQLSPEHIILLFPALSKLKMVEELKKYTLWVLSIQHHTPTPGLLNQILRAFIDCEIEVERLTELRNTLAILYREHGASETQDLKIRQGAFGALMDQLQEITRTLYFISGGQPAKNEISPPLPQEAEL